MRAWVYRANKWVVRISLHAASLLFIGGALVAGEAVAVGVYLVTGTVSLTWVISTTAFVTLVVGAPVVYYSQYIIRRLDQSKRELRKAMEHLAVARQDAEAADRMKSEFLASMSHELRTPLNAVIGFSEVMQSELFGPLGSNKYREYVEDIRDCGAHLLGLINAILDLSKIEAGAFQFEEELVDIAEVADLLQRQFGVIAAKRGVELQRQIEPDLPLLTGSSRLLRQILTNLISNAVKFSKAGQVVRIEARRRGRSKIEISVSDHGIGMTPDEVRIALQPFRQVDSRLSRKHEGTGLGLPLAKAMTELMNGALHVHSQPGLGTTATVRFTLGASSEARWAVT